ncbi:uncharacterized protein LOC144094855 isoform X1 [Amblyomma americanum]
MHHTLLQNRTCVHVVLLLAKGLKHSVTGCCVRMAVKGSVLLLSVVVAFVSVPLVSTCGAQESVGCPPVDDWRDNATLLANPLNCSTFYICSQGTPLLFVCPADLHFSDALKVCDYPFRANCVPLQPAPAPPTAEVVTTKDTILFGNANNQPNILSSTPTVANVQATTSETSAVASAEVLLGDLLSTPVTAADYKKSTIADVDVGTNFSGVLTEVKKNVKGAMNKDRHAHTLHFILGACVGVSLIVASLTLLRFLRAREKRSRATHFCCPR